MKIKAGKTGKEGKGPEKDRGTKEGARREREEKRIGTRTGAGKETTRGREGWREEGITLRQAFPLFTL